MPLRQKPTNVCVLQQLQDGEWVDVFDFKLCRPRVVTNQGDVITIINNDVTEQIIADNPQVGGDVDPDFDPVTGDEEAAARALCLATAIAMSITATFWDETPNVPSQFQVLFDIGVVVMAGIIAGLAITSGFGGFILFFVVANSVIAQLYASSLVRPILDTLALVFGRRAETIEEQLIAIKDSRDDIDADYVETAATLMYINMVNNNWDLPLWQTKLQGEKFLADNERAFVEFAELLHDDLTVFQSWLTTAAAVKAFGASAVAPCEFGTAPVRVTYPSDKIYVQLGMAQKLIPVSIERPPGSNQYRPLTVRHKRSPSTGGESFSTTGFTPDTSATVYFEWPSEASGEVEMIDHTGVVFGGDHTSATVIPLDEASTGLSWESTNDTGGIIVYQSDEWRLVVLTNAQGVVRTATEGGTFAITDLIQSSTSVQFWHTPAGQAEVDGLPPLGVMVDEIRLQRITGFGSIRALTFKAW